VLLIPPKILIRELRTLLQPLPVREPTRSVLPLHPSGAPVILLATNAPTPLLPTTPSPISANSAPITLSGRLLLVAARNSPSNAPPDRPTIPPLKDAIPQSLASPTSFTTQPLASVNPSVLLDRSDCVLPKLLSGTPRLFIARSAERIRPSGTRLPMPARAAPRTLPGT
jgi:hypothetical protein